MKTDWSSQPVTGRRLNTQLFWLFFSSGIIFAVLFWSGLSQGPFWAAQPANARPKATLLGRSSTFEGTIERTPPPHGQGAPPQPAVPVAELFADPGSVPFFVQGNQLVEGIQDASMHNQPPETLLQTIKRTYDDADITFNQRTDYGSEALYEAINEQGRSLIYISLVRLKQGTLLVIWQNNPHLVGAPANSESSE